MPTIRSAQVTEPGGQFSIVEHEAPEPGRGHVRITVEACGVCHTDALFINGQFPGTPFPLVAGHEIAGRVDAIGEGVEGWTPRGGELIVIGVTPEPIQVSPTQIITLSTGVHGHPSGTAREVEETLHFAALAGVRTMIETRPFDEIQAAYDRMLSGEARFRMVLTTGK